MGGRYGFGFWVVGEVVIGWFKCFGCGFGLVWFERLLVLVRVSCGLGVVGFLGWSLFSGCLMVIWLGLL